MNELITTTSLFDLKRAIDSFNIFKKAFNNECDEKDLINEYEALEKFVKKEFKATVINTASRFLTDNFEISKKRFSKKYHDFGYTKVYYFTSPNFYILDKDIDLDLLEEVGKLDYIHFYNDLSFAIYMSYSISWVYEMDGFREVYFKID